MKSRGGGGGRLWWGDHIGNINSSCVNMKAVYCYLRIVRIFFDKINVTNTVSLKLKEGELKENEHEN